MNFTYARLEILRTFRNTRFVIFAIAFPVLLFLLQATIFARAKANASDHGAVAAVLMVNMMAFGTVSGSMSVGARLAFERAAGWQRQLRLTPLSGPGYLGGKMISGMLVALPPLILVPLIAALFEGVHLGAGDWLHIVLGIWLGAIPFVLVGLLLGQFGAPDSMQPVTMVVTMCMGFLGGLWIPIESLPGWLHGVAQALPSYWLIQIARPVVTHDLTVGLGTTSGALAIFTAVFGSLMIRRYRNDSARA
jgi:ABC-2 type transport system permease protein